MVEWVSKFLEKKNEIRKTSDKLSEITHHFETSDAATLNAIIFQSYTDFNCAVTELIGHCYFGDEKQFNKWTEGEIHTQLSGYDIGIAFEYNL